MIKWPNDIVINGKKICGILTEMSAQFDYINHIVIGIGINVHNESFPEELQDHAGSLLLECGKRVHRADLIEAFLEEFERLYAIYLQTEDLSALQEEYDQLLVNRGRQVRVLTRRSHLRERLWELQKGRTDRRHLGVKKTGVFRRSLRERNLWICLKRQMR